VAGGLIGARLWYMALWESYSFIDYMLAVFDYTKGGLASSGAFLGVAVTAVLYAKLSKTNLWAYADLFGIAGGITVAIARFACFFTGCCYGALADLPWSVYYLGALRHPTQLYEIIAGVVIFLTIGAIKHRKRFSGYFFLLFITMYSGIRFFIEFAREEPHLGILTYSQYIYATFFAITMFLILLASKERKGWQKMVLEIAGLRPLREKPGQNKGKQKGKKKD